MNELGAYDDIDMHGLARACYEDVVPAEAQKRLIAAFPQMRVIWNCRHSIFQFVYREAGWKQEYYLPTGISVMDGWSFTPLNAAPPLKIDVEIEKLRWLDAQQQERSQRRGFENAAAEADFLADQEIARLKRQHSDELDDILGIDSERRCMKPGGIIIPHLRGPAPLSASQQRKARRAREAAARA